MQTTTPRWVWVLLGLMSTAAFGCDQLGLSKEDAKAKAEDDKEKNDKSDDKDDDEDEDEDEDDDKKKKKKDKDDEDDEETAEEDDDKDEETEADKDEETAEEEATAEEADAGTEAGNEEVVRYGDKEEPQTGSITIDTAVFARVDANTTSKTVIVLQPGSVVKKEALFQGFFLVSWETKKEGKKLAWVEVSKVAKKAPVAKTPPPPPPPPKAPPPKIPPAKKVPGLDIKPGITPK